MPIYPPRNEPIKKKQQLSQKRLELENAIRNKVAIDRLNKSAEKYRVAQLSLLKAKLHELQERQLQNKPQLTDFNSLEMAINKWTSKSLEEIIREFKNEG